MADLFDDYPLGAAFDELLDRDRAVRPRYGPVQDTLASLRPDEVSARAEALAVLGNGTWIGLLERFAITGTILVGYPEGVAVVVAVKALGRLPELREHPVAGERFVVGSLASLVWSAGVGLAGRALLGGL